MTEDTQLIKGLMFCDGRQITLTGKQLMDAGERRSTYVHATITDTKGEVVFDADVLCQVHETCESSSFTFVDPPLYIHSGQQLSLKPVFEMTDLGLRLKCSTEQTRSGNGVPDAHHPILDDSKL